MSVEHRKHPGLYDMEPRIAPLPASQWTDEMRELMSLPRDGLDADVSDFLSTLVRYPGLYRRFAGFSGKLLITGKLPARDRELAILRNAWLCRAPYEWGEHVAIAHQAGLSTAEIERIVAGPDHPDWNAHECAIVRAVDELHACFDISDATWAVLQKRYDEKQLIELPMLIGAYRMIAYVQNSLRIRLRETNPGLSAR